MRIAFLTNIVSPYRRGVFERLAATPGWDFRLFVNAEREFDRAWDVNVDGLPITTSRTLTWRRRVVTHAPVRFEQAIELHVPTGLWGDLRSFSPDVIISHELGPRTMVAAAYTQAFGRKLAIWAYQSRVSGAQGGRVKRAMRRTLLKRAHIAIGMGRQAREVLRSLGVEDERIADAPNAADHVGLAAQLTSPAHESAVADVRGRFSGRRIALFVGRLIPLKGIVELLEAWNQLPQPLKDRWQLVFVGDGPMRSMLDNAGPGVCCVGPVKAAHIAAWYKAADLHVFPTLCDVWGLVVNEASQCGTPTLCSIYAGCADDMIADGRTGFVFDPADKVQFARVLRDTLSHADLTAVGRAAEAESRAYTLDRLAGCFRSAVERIS